MAEAPNRRIETDMNGDPIACDAVVGLIAQQRKDQTSNGLYSIQKHPTGSARTEVEPSQISR
ncbi:hypothetical protein CHU95_03235 [Niveispirillum lacus]|uniref:Uncharacterized protein n=1 Tax=Niveispirillum lacus TaxID=1981099 RepID=A0A255Z5N4_9PROT|nr:hypothetical protein CHU95_03235 [Niveispirillum lacus]